MPTHKRTSLLTEREVAEELGIRQHADLAVKRLLAKRRIAHYPQPDGSARVEVSALDDYIRRGQPDRLMPDIRENWLDNRAIEFIAGSVERTLLGIIRDELPDEYPGADRFELRLSPALREQMSRPSPRATIQTASDGHPVIENLTAYPDALLVNQMRSIARRVLTSNDRMVLRGAPVQQLYKSARAYRSIVAVTIASMQESPLVRIERQYTPPEQPGNRRAVEFVLLVRTVAEQSKLERIADIAF